MLLHGNEWIVLLQYAVLFVSTNFINKYVLSVLKFTYPTIFQGWQTLVGAIVLRVLALTGKTDLNTSNITGSTLGSHVPVMMLFTLSIYAGSRALANLSIPAFLAISNVTSLFPALLALIVHKTFNGITYIKIMLYALTSIIICWTDPEFSSEGYFWMTVYIISTGSKNVLSSYYKSQLREIDKLYCSYVYSVIILAPSSYFLGDALAATSFPFLYFYRFYVGCLLSGVFGLFLQLSAIQLSEKDMQTISPAQLHGSSKILAALLSFVFFDMIFTSSNLLWIFINLSLELLPNESTKIKEHDEQPPKSPVTVLTEM